MKKLKICIVFGTRPEIIKVAPIVKEARKRNHLLTLVHTGQHYSPEMSMQILQDFGIRENINLGCNEDRREIGVMISKIQDHIEQNKYDCVLSEGDTDSVLATAIACNKSKIEFGHVEAGLRSFDRNMPEENNRVLADQISDYLFAPSEHSMKYLIEKSECRKDRVFLTGNTIIDTLIEVKQKITKSNALINLGLAKESYILMTLHRAETVDTKERLEAIIETIGEIKQKIIFPIHPRTRKRISEFGLTNIVPKNLKLINPLNYIDFINLSMNSKFIITDSGGIQEECTFYKKPVILLRENTERPEVLGTYVWMVGYNRDKIIQSISEITENYKNILKKIRKLESPYGDGHAAERIINILEKYHIN